MHRRICKVIGVGNPLMGDDGLGILAVEQLRGCLPDAVELIDGGCGGLTLLDFLADCDFAVIIDAADFGGRPGELIRLSADQITPRSEEMVISFHQTGVAEALHLARELDQLPETVLLLVQPQTVEREIGLSPAVLEALPLLMERVSIELNGRLA